ncbi:hypothetical protein Agub_g756 [Astrephomene gubernaculifera]|uniref:Centrosomal protein of 44 kDa n=1 Tax=Astrephomene gubernaculifera TaxID=47775 RepID=A0AAD3DE70_9CHLO|nr:hypothetical protein Agub_g756 [Astrephomene gubernaculifera]
MSTGDLNGNVQRLLRELKAIKYPADVDEVGLRLGDPVAFLPLLSYSLLKFSRLVARFIVRNGFELAGKTDQRFIEASFKLFRDVLNVRTVLTPVQFFEHGFAERKVLLLCDVIAVCKKLHNDEVRHERLAALKASRQPQEPVSNRTPLTRKTSPVVKVVRNEDVEVHQILAPQHLPHATDGAQSVYRTRRTVASSPSPSPSVPPGRASAGPHAAALGALQAPRKGDALEATLRPAVRAPAGQASGSRPAAPSAQPQPIHTWFLNPAFDGAEEGATDLGFSFGLGAGIPDSSAWWKSTASPAQPQATVSANQLRSSPPERVAGRHADNSKHLYYGARTGTQAAAGPTAGHQGQPGQPQQQQGTRATAQQRSGPGTASGAMATAAGGSTAASSGAAFASRGLDEWSFSNFFGPGKVSPVHAQRRSSVAEDDDSSQELAGASGGGVTEEQASDGPEAYADANQHRHGQHWGLSGQGDRHVMHQSHPFTAHQPGGASGPLLGSGAAAPQQGGQLLDQQPRHPAREVAAAAADTDVVWQVKLEQLERESREQLQQLREKLAAVEEELERCRAEGKQTRDVMQASITVLEGRVRFLECELDLCVKRPPGYGDSAPVHNTGFSPGAVARAGQGPSAGPSPARPRSAGPALQAAGPLGTSVWSSPSRSPSAAAPAPAAAQGAAYTTMDSRAQAGGPADSGRREAYTSASVDFGGHDHARSGLGASATGMMSTASAIGSTGSTFYPSRPLATAAPAAPPSQPVAQQLPAFSPMPPPSFSFQPRSLMQQVAAATVPQPAQAVQRPVEAMGSTRYMQTTGPGSHVLRSSFDSGAPNSQDAVPGSTAAALGTTSVRTSMDTGMLSGSSMAAGASAGEAAGAGSADASRAYVSSWRPSERERAGVRHAGPTSILDGLGAQPQQQPGRMLPGGGAAASQGLRALQPQGAAHATQPGNADVVHAGNAVSSIPSGSGLSAVGGAAAGAHPGASVMSTPAAGLPGPGAVGEAPATAGEYRSTNDLINSLYMRYTDANDFLQTLRKR